MQLVRNEFLILFTIVKSFVKILFVNILFPLFSSIVKSFRSLVHRILTSIQPTDLHFSLYFPSSTGPHLCVVMCWILPNFISYVQVHAPNDHSEDTGDFHPHKDSSCCPFITNPPSPNSLSVAQPLGTTKPLIGSPFVHSCYFGNGI